MQKVSQELQEAIVNRTVPWGLLVMWGFHKAEATHEGKGNAGKAHSIVLMLPDGDECKKVIFQFVA